jgi:hypothetical protein
MKALFALVFFLFCFTELLSQNNSSVKTISGVVYDGSDSTTLPFASINILASTYGTVTNADGYFEIKIPERHLIDTLKVSFIGFQSYLINISETDSTQSDYFLKRQTNFLPDFELTVFRDSLETVLYETFSRLEQNYPKQQYYQDFFYREMTFFDDQIVRVIEAAAELQDFGFDSSIERQRVKVLELRKSDSFIERSLLMRIAGYDKRNGILTALKQDFLRRYKKNNVFHSFDKSPFLAFYDFRFEDLVVKDSVNFYLISFETNPEKKEIFHYSGKLLVNSKNYAIEEFQYVLPDIFGNIGKNDPMKTEELNTALNRNGEYLSKSVIKYREFEGVYYPYFIQCVLPESFSATKKDGTGQQFTEYNLVFNETYISKKDFDRIKRREKLESKDLYSIEFDYNEDFWNNFNILDLPRIDKNSLKLLEAEQSINSQFKKQGNEK